MLHLDSVPVAGMFMVRHWFIGYFAHNQGHRDWHAEGTSVQGYNIRFCELITMGECWHHNHRAFPGSALPGINADQTDPGWWMLRLMAAAGLVWDIKTPEDMPARHELVRVGGQGFAVAV
jgi:stearoyl-CoA desaturase (delta-9 desaturase)